MQEVFQKDVHYNVHKLDQEIKREILMFAKERCYKWWADEMVGIRRQLWNIPFENVMELFAASSFFIVIHRKGYNDWDHYGEVGFSTSGNPTQFLWINIKEDKLEDLVEHFELKAIP